MAVFQYHPGILEKFPALVGGVFIAEGVRNDLPAPELAALYHAEQQAVITRIGTTPLSEIASLAAWRSAFRAFGVDPTQYRSAGESLLRRLTKKGDIPAINPLVDLGNLISIRYGLPVAVMDRRNVKGALTVRFADGTETYTTLNEDDDKHPHPGEVIFADESNVVYARRWCWRQSEPSAARPDTRDIVIAIEAHHTAGPEDVRRALADLEALLRAHVVVEGDVRMAILGKDQPGA